MRKGRIPTWLMLMLAAVGLLLVAIPGLWVYVSITATPLHANPGNVPTVARSAPSTKSAGAVEKARQIVLAHLTEENLPGLSVATGIDGDIVWAEGFGFADLRTGVPVTPDHRFRIGTASTVLTSAAAGLLLENGRLKLDDEIHTFLPAFPREQWPVTLRDLMAHTAGFIPDRGDGRPLFTNHCERPVEALQYFAENSLLFQPGTQYRYSSHGWILVSAAVEAAAKQPFLRFLREQIFDPLGMRHTIADPAAGEADDDFPLFNSIRELIYDPRATRDTSTKKPVQDRVTPYFTRFRSDPNYGLHLMAPPRLFLLRGGERIWLHSVRPGALRDGDETAASTCNPPPSNCSRRRSGLPRARRRVTVLAGTSGLVTLAGKQTRAIGHDGD